MRKTLLLFLCIGFFNHIYAQNVYHHNMFWGRLVLSDKITPKLRWEFYLQKRTQNAEPGTPNIFQAHHFSSIWLWVNYSPNKNLKLSVSPFGYFDSHIFNTTEADIQVPGVKEFRWASRLETRQDFKFLNYYNRYSLEYRWRDLLNNNVYQPNWRIRYMARLEKPVKGILSKDKPVTFFLSDEIFIQFGKAVKNNPNIFDQNRINIGASYEIIKNIKLSVSYLNIIQERNSGKAFDVGNCLWVILTFDNLFSQFKSNAKENN